MHRTAVTVVLFVLAKELVSLPDPKDVVDVHLHLDELEDVTESDDNKIILHNVPNTVVRYHESNALPSHRQNSPTIQKICSNVNCNENQGSRQSFNDFICCQKNNAGFEANGYQPSGYQPNGYQPSGYQPNGYQPSGYQVNGHQPSGYQPNGYQPSGYQPNGYQPSGYQPNGYQPSGYQPSGYQPNGYQPSGYQANGYHPSGYQANGYQASARGNQAGGNQPSGNLYGLYQQSGIQARSTTASGTPLQNTTGDNSSNSESKTKQRPKKGSATRFGVTQKV